MIKKIFILTALTGLIGCKKDLPEVESKPKWELVTEMSGKNFTTGTVINNKIILMSKESIITFDSDHKILQNQAIFGKKSVETRSPYILENSNLLSIPTYYFPNPGSTDSISIRFQKIDSDLTSIIEHKQFPEYQTRAYKATLFQSDVMSNDGDNFSIIICSWDKSDISEKTDNYYSILRISLNQIGGLSSSIDKMIKIPELPVFGSNKKYDFVRFKDYDYILAEDGTHVIDKNGYKEKIESRQAIFKDSESIMQLRGNSIYFSNDGLTWTKKVDIQSNTTWSHSYNVRLFDNILIEYGWSKGIKYADIVTGTTDRITDNGLSESEGLFLIEYNGYYYLGLENKLVYRIKKDEALDLK